MTAPHTQGRLGVRATYYRGHGEEKTFLLTSPHGSDLHSCGGDYGTMRKPEPYSGYGLTEANARRLAACWNACQGLDTQAIEDLAENGGVRALSERAAKLLAEQMYPGIVATERDQLRAELEVARALLLEALPHINPKAAVMALARTGPMSEAYVNTRVRRFLEGAP